MSISWEDLARRFDEIEPPKNDFEIYASWDASGFPSTGTKWRLGGSARDTMTLPEQRFVDLARLVVIKLGESDGQDAFARLLDRIYRDLPGLRRLPVDRPDGKFSTGGGVARLAAQLCRHYEVEEVIGQLSTASAKKSPATPDAQAGLRDRVRAHMNQQGISEHRFATLASIDHKTIKNLLDGRRVRRDVQTRLDSFLQQ